MDEGGGRGNIPGDAQRIIVVHRFVDVDVLLVDASFDKLEMVVLASIVEELREIVAGVQCVVDGQTEEEGLLDGWILLRTDGRCCLAGVRLWSRRCG